MGKGVGVWEVVCTIFKPPKTLPQHSQRIDQIINRNRTNNHIKLLLPQELPALLLPRIQIEYPPTIVIRFVAR
jgi:hypothetical protein